MKFLCVECDAQMNSVGQRSPGDGTLALVFRCPECGREVAMLANPMETQMVNSLCVKVGPTGAQEGRTGGEGAKDGTGIVDQGEGTDAARRAAAPPFEMVRSRLRPGDGTGGPEPAARGPAPGWSVDAEARLRRVPGFVRGMIRQLYVEWAQERGIVEITPEVMDRAREDLDLEGI